MGRHHRSHHQYWYQIKQQINVFRPNLLRTSAWWNLRKVSSYIDFIYLNLEYKPVGFHHNISPAIVNLKSDTSM